jgi:hypothetical protein
MRVKEKEILHLDKGSLKIDFFRFKALINTYEEKFKPVCYGRIISIMESFCSVVEEE